MFPAIHVGNQDGVPAFYPGPAFTAIWKSGSADKSLSSKNKSLKRITQYKAGHKFILFHMSFQNAEKCVISGVGCRGSVVVKWTTQSFGKLQSHSQPRSNSRHCKGGEENPSLPSANMDISVLPPL